MMIVVPVVTNPSEGADSCFAEPYKNCCQPMKMKQLTNEVEEVCLKENEM